MLAQDSSAWKKVIFVDWHGVLCRDPFWISILDNPYHPLHHKLTVAADTLFNEETLIHDWMRNHVTAGQIVNRLQIKLDESFPVNYLSRKLIEDCRLMRVNQQLVQLLQDAQNPGVAIVLATDNMDCFYESFLRVRQRSSQAAECETASFIATARMFDEILCSSQSRVLKREDPQRFYGDWLNRHALDFSDALLLDDLEINCKAFRSAGGIAIRVQENKLIEQADLICSQIAHWLQTATSDIQRG